MADLGAAIIVGIKADATAAGSRVYPDTLKQGCTLPAVVVSIDDDSKFHHLTAASGVSQATVEIDCYAATRAAANSLGAAVDTYLDRLDATTLNSVVVRHVHSTFRLEDYDRPIAGETVGRFIDRREFLATYED